VSYLDDIKAKLEASRLEAFAKDWAELIEPAIKQSFKNGLETGRQGRKPKKSEPKEEE
jgi:hypothetical protein